MSESVSHERLGSENAPDPDAANARKLGLSGVPLLIVGIAVVLFGRVGRRARRPSTSPDAEMPTSLNSATALVATECSASDVPAQSSPRARARSTASVRDVTLSLR